MIADIFYVLITMLFWLSVIFLIIGIIKLSLNKGYALPLKGSFKRFFDFWLKETSKKITVLKIILFGLVVRLITFLIANYILTINNLDNSIINTFHSFVRWDASHYLTLAEFWYTYQYNGQNVFLVFFPLQPFLIRFVGTIIGSYFAAGFVVSITAYLAALCFMYFLARIDFSVKVSWLSILFISVFTHSFFFGTPHTESIFLLSTVVTLYFIRKHSWILAGITGAIASSSRAVGIVLFGTALIELFIHYRMFKMVLRRKWKLFFHVIFFKAGWLCLMPVGLGIYLLINWAVSGDPLRFVYFQENHWHTSFQYFVTTFRYQFSLIEHFQSYRAARNFFVIPNIYSVILCVVLVFYASIKRFNSSMIAYSLVYIMISFSFTWLLSGGRYAAALAPIFIYLAEFASKSKQRIYVILFSFVIGLVLILRAYLLGAYVM